MADVVRALLPAGELEIATLRLDEELLAYNLCLLCAGVVGNYSNVYRESARKYSPGTVLLAENIRWAIEGGHREYDFMRGVEPYKDWWATGHRAEVDLIVTRPGPRSRLAAALLVEARARLKASPAVVRLRDLLLHLGVRRP